jgi:hypothetical protein
MDSGGESNLGRQFRRAALLCGITAATLNWICNDNYTRGLRNERQRVDNREKTCESAMAALDKNGPDNNLKLTDCYR